MVGKDMADNIGANEAKELLEESFRLIQQGNEYAAMLDHWKAAHCFALAQAHLARLAAEHEQKSHPTSSNSNSQEMRKIAELYHQQSVEYLKKGRKALVQALEQDTATDGPVLSTEDGIFQQQGPSTSTTSSSPSAGAVEDALQLLSAVSTTTTSRLLHDLSDEDAAHRRNLFSRLFAKLEEEEDAAADTVEEQESALAARLAQLTHALPRSVKSEQEQMRELNRGLARLGLEPVHDATASAPHQHHMRTTGGLMFGIDVAPKTECEQVAEIIAQAKDEMALNHGGGGGDDDAALAEAAAAGRIPQLTAEALMATNRSEEDDDDIDESVAEDEDGEDSNISDDDDDVEWTPELCRDLHHRLAEAQASLSELVALFAEDTAGDVAIEFDPARGKAILRDTRLRLRQVAQQWSAH